MNDDKILYYCQHGKCKKDILKNATTKGETARYKGNIAYTRDDCFGSCNWSSESDSNKPTLVKMKGNNSSHSKPITPTCIILIVATIILVLIALGVFFM